MIAEPSAPREGTWATHPVRYLLVTLYWLPVTLFWSMMLGQILPARVEDFAGPLQKGTYLFYLGFVGAGAAALIQLVIGPISDSCRVRWGRRRPFLVFGTLGALAAMYFFATAHSFPGLLLAFFCIQTLLNIANGPFQAFIPDQVPKSHQGQASGWMGIMSLLGEAGGPIVAGLFLAHAATAADPAAAKIVAIQTMFWIVGSLLLVAMLLSVFFVPDSPSDDTRTPVQAVAALAKVRPRRHPDFFGLLLSRLVYNLGIYLALGNLAYYTKDSLGFNEKDYHGPLTLLQLCAIGAALLSTFPAGALSDKISKKRVIYASCIFSALAGAAFAFAPNVSFAYGMALLFGLGFGIFRAVDWAFACNLLPQDGGAAQYMAIWSLSTTIPQVLSPLFGPVADALNKSFGLGTGWRGAMLAASVAFVASLALITRVKEHPTP